MYHRYPYLIKKVTEALSIMLNDHWELKHHQWDNTIYTDERKWTHFFSLWPEDGTDSVDVHANAGFALVKKGYVTPMRVCIHGTDTDTIYTLSDLGLSIARFGLDKDWIFYPFDDIQDFYRPGFHLRGFTAIGISDTAYQHIQKGGAYVFRHTNRIYKFQNGFAVALKSTEGQTALNELIVMG